MKSPEDWPRAVQEVPIWLIMMEPEGIADLTKRPLFTINSRDIKTEQSLTALLRLAASWKAVVLLDEADVFMQKRQLDTPAANEFVASMLSPTSILLWLHTHQS